MSTLLLLAGCAPQAEEADAPPAASAEPAAQGAAELAFRPALNEAPPGFTPAFELSHDYPRDMTTCADAATHPWLAVDVDFTDQSPTYEGAWSQYMDAILTYIREGQDPTMRNEVGFQVDVNGATRWYHVPWMAFDGHSGREYVHGLTNELSVDQGSFIGPGRGSGMHHLPLANQTSGELFETWAFGAYNPCGGYTVGQAFPESGEPAVSSEGGRQLVEGMPFREGALVAKMLFTTATPEQVPYLQGTARWQANRHVPRPGTERQFDECARSVADVHFIQMDVAVVDERSPSRWVYGTFVYNSTLGGDTFWDNLSSLGVQYGSDPQTFPAVPESESRDAFESILAPIDLYEHYGCNNRLAGPVDEAESACLTCHMGSFTANVGGIAEFGRDIPAIFEFSGICYEYNEENANYFSNYKYPDPYPGGQYPDAIPLDSSLQLWVAFSQYGTWNTLGHSSSCTEGQ